MNLDKTEQIFYIINGDSIPKNRKYEYTNEAQTLVVWAFSNFVRTLRTTICKKSIITLGKFLDRIFTKTVCATLTNFLKRKKYEKQAVYLHTQPESYRAIKLYNDFGFNITKEDSYGYAVNEYEDAMGILKDVMNAEAYKRLKNTAVQ